MNYQGYLNVTIACADQAQASAVAVQLLQEKLVACVQQSAVHSQYWWQGNIEQAAEVLLTAKTHSDRFDALVQCVQALHSYALPEIIGLPIVCANSAYLHWLDQEIGRK